MKTDQELIETARSRLGLTSPVLEKAVYLGKVWAAETATPDMVNKLTKLYNNRYSYYGNELIVVLSDVLGYSIDTPNAVDLTISFWKQADINMETVSDNSAISIINSFYTGVVSIWDNIKDEL